MKNRRIRPVAVICALVLLLTALSSCGGIEKREDGSLDLLHADLKPYIELGQYKELPVELAVERVTDEDVESAFLQFTDSLGSFEDYRENPVDRLTEKNDFLRIRFKGFYNGEQFEGGTSEDESILLAENNGFIDWFEDDLYGVRVGDTVSTSGTLPDIEGYGEMANKDVVFEITVLEIVGHYYFVEVTDALIKEKTGYDTVDAYKEYLRTALDSSIKAEAASDIYGRVLEMATENAKVLKYPEEQVEYHYNSFYGYYAYYAAQNGYTTEQLLEMAETTTEEIMEESRAATKEDLLFAAIVQAEGLEVTDEEYAEGLAVYAESQQTTAEALEEQYGKAYIRESLLYDEMVVFLAENAKVTYTYKGE